MFLSSPLFKETALARGKSVYPKIVIFKEILPISLKNRVVGRGNTAAGSSCTQELQALFGCLKKWEFDDKPCAKLHQSYMSCVHESERVANEFKEATKKGTLGEGTTGKSMTTAQFNKIMQLFPQPNMGRAPYRKMKRLPTQSYDDDIYHRQQWRGKAS